MTSPLNVPFDFHNYTSEVQRQYLDAQTKILISNNEVLISNNEIKKLLIEACNGDPIMIRDLLLVNSYGM
jgi:hypothetical protein